MSIVASRWWIVGIVQMVVALAQGHGVLAQPKREIFESANHAATVGDLEGAIEGYLRLLDAGVHDPDVYFNLGTTYAKRSEYGRAIAFLERSLSLDPGNAQTRETLLHVRNALGARQAEQLGEALVEAQPPFREALFKRIPEGVLAVTLALGLGLLFLGIGIWPSVRRDTTRVALGIALPVTFLLTSTAAVGVLSVRGMLDEGDTVFVVGERPSLLEGPDPKATTRGRAVEGQRATALRKDRSYVDIRLPGGERGWIHRSEIIPLQPTH